MEDQLFSEIHREKCSAVCVTIWEIEMNAVTIEIQLDPESINAFIDPKDAVGPVDESNYEEIHAIMCEAASKLEKFGSPAPVRILLTAISLVNSGPAVIFAFCTCTIAERVVLEICL